MTERTDLALWLNDNRQSETHPHLKAGKPVTVDGKQFWASAWINSGQDPEIAEAVDRMAKKLAEVNGTRPIIKISLTPVDGKAQEPQAPQARQEPEFEPDQHIPF